MSKKSGSNGVKIQSASDIVDKMGPYLEKLISLYAQAAPYIEKGKKYFKIASKKVEPYYKQYYHPDMLQAILGIVLLLFGGQFAMSIACYMAVQLSGWDTIKESYNTIKRNYKTGMEAFENDKDSKKFFDSDGDGKISAKELGDAAQKIFKGTAEEKAAVFQHLRCILVAIDPNEVMNGISGIWTVAICVIATLRSTFAKDIALGVSLGAMVSANVSKYIKPFLTKRVDEDMKKWVDFGVDTACRMFGISMAMILVRIVSAFHSAIKGGAIIAHIILKFLTNKKFAPPSANMSVNVESTQLFMALQYGLGMAGFWVQLKAGFAINSVILRLFLLPFTICELFLTFMAAY